MGSVMLGGAFAKHPRSQPTVLAAAERQGQGGAENETENGVKNEQEGEDGKEENPRYTGSIQVSEDRPGQSEEAEAAALQSQARITADQARAAALDRFAGATVRSVVLENENGSLVYGLRITDKAGKGQDVKVDAGNAKVLHVEADGSEDHEGDESQEGSEGGGDVD
jgi:uncharacterized membrane protein YkoI